MGQSVSGAPVELSGLSGKKEGQAQVCREGLRGRHGVQTRVPALLPVS